MFKKARATIYRIVVLLALLPIKLYSKLISPVLGPRCRFYPSCSQYAITAISTLGLLNGGFCALKRLLRCNPFHDGGYDPVPNNDKNRKLENG